MKNFAVLLVLTFTLSFVAFAQDPASGSPLTFTLGSPLPPLPSTIVAAGYGNNGSANAWVELLKDTGFSNGDHGHIYSFTKVTTYNFRQLIGKSSATAQASDYSTGAWFPVYDHMLSPKYRITFGVGGTMGATTTGQNIGWNYGAKTGFYLSRVGSKFGLAGSWEPTNGNITGSRYKEYSIGAGYDVSNLLRKN
jgi:hypothetical protein